MCSKIPIVQQHSFITHVDAACNMYHTSPTNNQEKNIKTDGDFYWITTSSSTTTETKTNISILKSFSIFSVIKQHSADTFNIYVHFHLLSVSSLWMSYVETVVIINKKSKDRHEVLQKKGGWGWIYIITLHTRYYVL